MRYERYKKTGISWLPEVPEGWEVRRVKYLLVQVVEPSKSHCKVGLENIESKTGKFVESKAEFEGDGVAFKKGDLLYGKLRPYLAKVWMATFEGNAVGDFIVLRPRVEFDSRFALYYMLSSSFTGICNAATYGAKMPRVSPSFVSSLPLPVPTKEEQVMIVSYLDDKCSKVDRLVEAKMKEVKLLKELRERVIADAVTGRGSLEWRSERVDTASSREEKVAGMTGFTRGAVEISGERKFKASGIPWLPEVPEGWEVAKVRQYFRLRSEKVSEKDYPALSVAKVGVVPQLSDVAISMAEGDTRKLVREGDFVVNSRSDRKGSCGIAPRDGSVTTISIVLEPRGINHKYVHYLFRSVPWVEEFYRNGRGIVADLWTTRYQEMRNMLLPVPTKEEQVKIVDYIEQRCAKIDALQKKLEEEVQRLKEFRERLVADVVTGQRKVV